MPEAWRKLRLLRQERELFQKCRAYVMFENTSAFPALEKKRGKMQKDSRKVKKTFKKALKSTKGIGTIIQHSHRF